MSSGEIKYLSYSIGIKVRNEDLPIDEFNEKIKNMQDSNRITEREEAKLRLLRAKQVKGRAARSYCERKKSKMACLDADLRILREVRRLYIKEKELLSQEIFIICKLQSGDNITPQLRETESM